MEFRRSDQVQKRCIALLPGLAVLCETGAAISSPEPSNRTILHLIPTLEGGGAERQLSMLAAEQARRGLNVHIGFRRAGIYGATLQNEGVNLHPLGDFRGFSFRFLWNLDALIRRTRPDLIQTWLTSMDILGGLAATGHRLPWLISERSSAPNYRSGPANRVRMQLSRFASGVVANSNGGLEYWKSAGPPGLVRFVIPNALALTEIQRALPEPPPDAAGSTILVVGRLSSDKGLSTILEAAFAIKSPVPVSFVIMGDGEERARIDRAISEAGIPGRVILLPYKQDWWGMLKPASALVSMSAYEGSPNIVLEAMAAGCPLIVSDIPAHREFLDENKAILVPRGDSAALIGAVQRLLADPLAARRRADLAKADVSELTVGRAAELYEEVYRTMRRVV